MRIKRCSSCLFGDKCVSNTGCEYYTPLDEDMTDAELEQYIESERRAYRQEWLRYIENDDQVFLFP